MSKADLFWAEIANICKDLDDSNQTRRGSSLAIESDTMGADTPKKDAIYVPHTVFEPE